MSNTSANLGRWTRRLLSALAATVAVVAYCNTARAEDELAKVDKAVNNWKTLDYHYNIVTKKAEESPAVLKLQVLMKQAKSYIKQFISITGGDLNGTKVLTIKPTKMYIYLPSFKKIRRVASHMTEQGFLGTALSQRDLTLTRYAKYYKSKVLSKSEGSVTLSLTARDESAPYPKLEMDVSTSNWMPTTIRYFNEKGAKIKTETRTGYMCADNYCVAKVMEMTDHTNGVTSTLTLTKHKINPKIPKKVFTKRYLQQ